MTAVASFTAEDVALGDHLFVPYDSDAESLAYTVDVATVGLARGHRVLLFTHGLTPAQLRAELVRRVPGFAEASGRGQLAVVSTWDVHLVRGVFDGERMRRGFATAIDEARRDGYGGLWVSVDMTWASEDLPGVERLVDYEAGAGGLFARRHVAAVCQYDRRVFDPDLLARACAGHSGSPGNARLRHALTDRPAGAAFSGQIDATNRAAFGTLLAHLPVGAHIDLAGVDFLDAAAIGELVRAAAGWAPRRPTVVCRPAVERLLLLHGLDELATLRTAA
jgi:anti-anti-sigma regulatory factor